jgi:hypothetical protein
MSLTRQLSHAFVAYTIEVDAAVEARMPHRTTDHGGPRGAPWLVSTAMWFNCLRFLDAGATATVAELERRAGTSTNVDGMRRWGYVRVDGGVLRPTPAGLRARAAFAASLAETEARWAERFDLPRLRAALDGRVEVGLPDTLPILGYGLFSRAEATDQRSTADDAPLCVLLAHVLLAIALLFERRSKVSLAIAANTLRVLDARVADLPALTGASKEGNAMALGWLERSGLVEIGKDGRLRVGRLTPAGVAARDVAQKRLAKIEARIGDAELLAALEPIMGFRPAPSGWRAAGLQTQTLPHFPLVLHRGGYPDGA